ncbi:MAG: polysaccharide deacetylase family protein, partial [Oscillospiraceae bacterium]|nr:polysaccharide deacetylase family protein [Oscillospiraceae bacterium]
MVIISFRGVVIARILVTGQVNNKDMKKLLSLLIAFALALPFAAHADETAKFNIPVLMYHSIWSETGGEYIISPTALESDLKYLKANGYESITTKQLLLAASGDMSVLPEKPILLTFDDGQLNNVTEAEPLLAKYGYTGVLFIVGAYCDREEAFIAKGLPRSAKYSYLTWDEVKTASESSVWEIGSHTYDMHKDKSDGRFGVTRKYGESDEAYATALRADFTKINSKLAEVTGNAPISFAYPFGQTDNTARDELIKSGTPIIFTCRDKIAVVNGV